jgi:hypothetical protein
MYTRGGSRGGAHPARYTRKHTGADPGFQVRGVDLKKLRRAEGGTKIFGVFRVKNPDFTQKNHIFKTETRVFLFFFGNTAIFAFIFFVKINDI